MNPSFEKALAARLLWVNVAALEGIEECEQQYENAIQAAYDAVHDIASDEILNHRHYGPRAPMILTDVPELADQYNLCYEMSSELYYHNYHSGEPGEFDKYPQKPEKPLAIPYTKWTSIVGRKVAELMGVTCTRAQLATQSQDYLVVRAWSQGSEPDETAQMVWSAYKAFLGQLSKDELEQHLASVDAEQSAVEAAIISHWRKTRINPTSEGPDVAGALSKVEATIKAHWLCDCPERWVV